MTSATTRSAYPPAIEDLLPAARRLVDRLGELPSRNRLKTELHIGGPKAAAILDALKTGPDPSRELVADPASDRTPLADPVDPASPVPAAPAEPSSQATGVVDPGPVIVPVTVEKVPVRPRTVRPWPVLLLALPAFVAIWSGWVGLGLLTGFGEVHPLPGIVDSFSLNSAITLPIGMETYAAYALRVWLSPGVPARARRFAKWSAIGSLTLGAAGQVAYHLLTAAGVTHAPWQITTVVACLPVAVLGMGAALAHLLHANPDH